MAIDLKPVEDPTPIEIGDTVTFLPGYFMPPNVEVVVDGFYPNPFWTRIQMVRFTYRGEMRSAPLDGCVLVKSDKDINPYLWK